MEAKILYRKDQALAIIPERDEQGVEHIRYFLGKRQEIEQQFQFLTMDDPYALLRKNVRHG